MYLSIYHDTNLVNHFIDIQDAYTTMILDNEAHNLAMIEADRAYDEEIRALSRPFVWDTPIIGEWTPVDIPQWCSEPIGHDTVWSEEDIAEQNAWISEDLVELHKELAQDEINRKDTHNIPVPMSNINYHTRESIQAAQERHIGHSDNQNLAVTAMQAVIFALKRCDTALQDLGIDDDEFKLMALYCEQSLRSINEIERLW
jgi:hypothetical protein